MKVCAGSFFAMSSSLALVLVFRLVMAFFVLFPASNIAMHKHVFVRSNFLCEGAASENLYGYQKLSACRVR